ncbi:amidohydrolase [Macrococcoides caseolyticum subsp. caseolyticum]|uniref:M20 metallopeptidase family protein n=1 Tax=Macrococcoides caseolyticum TaxID=69966 RepID=UPI000CD2BC11|nr:amidohydrolase [Macrococcus caseolyticus]PNZ70133.1 amidohydrolase [Macrococcus caseolyticus]QPT46243.1 amidohydrolase [Macrococcus caseolyticus]QQB04771.1 amidohydrolase [Macrococcus caseolyticus]RAK45624.1 amidohydrolase [Macrococcus caseolyticus subsp. caseolyticus]TDM29031.1 amidohydrolase [Macrococcus caseolyticus]
MCMITLVNKYYDELVAIRRHLHMHPELSFQEEKTPEYIAAFLEEQGITVERNVGGRGVVGRLIKDESLPTLAIRADFDALPIQDEKDAPYKSQVPGVMHACGHDAHTAVLMITAKILAKNFDKINGNLVFIHQHAEEVDPGGAIQMIADNCLKGVDAIIGQHVSSDLDVGKLGYKYGTATGIPDDFWITIKGKGGHAAHPDTTIDPVAAAIRLCNDLQYIVSRKTSATTPAVISVTQLQAGDQNNVIPDSAKIAGTIRTFDPTTQKLMIDELKRCLEGLVTTMGITYDLKYSKGYPPVVNTTNETDLIVNAARKIEDIEALVELKPSLGGEDFSYYLQRVPGSFFYTGTRNENFKADFPHHHPKFDIDEKGMLNAVKVFLQATEDFFNKEDK